MTRFAEFFEGGGRDRLSMSRLVVFMAFWPATCVLIKNPTDTMMGLYLGAFVLSYLGGKSADIFMGGKELEDGGGSLGGDSMPVGDVEDKRVAGQGNGVRRGKKRPF